MRFLAALFYFRLRYLAPAKGWLLFPCDTEEQIDIVTIFAYMDEDIQAPERRLGKTRQIKQGMKQELLTGKARLIKEEAHG
ncbi:hypothetical protein [Photobacterium damselae]|uniref:hypothetical protein n=1 Tax=Photobacterium damselae TaxID=38293 RepID=UPI000A2FA09E|nr:hypothetical protein CAY62_21215 [Photobacterium damselae subsp. damselae]